MTKVYTGIPPLLENFRFEMTKVYSGITPPPQFRKMREIVCGDLSVTPRNTTGFNTREVDLPTWRQDYLENHNDHKKCKFCQILTSIAFYHVNKSVANFTSISELDSRILHVHVHTRTIHTMLPFEVSLFRIDEFAKFDQFGEKLPVHTKLLGGWKISLIPIYDYYW